LRRACALRPYIEGATPLIRHTNERFGDFIFWSSLSAFLVTWLSRDVAEAASRTIGGSAACTFDEDLKP
ncbi:hypothetical protein, partial [Oscillatoria sp. HE19RPO]|uniref:hypothetical protein n=1 Tax=Oscillatoria sp. HE19RPO TaxID=2954806 RepID=UPI0020C43785